MKKTPKANQPKADDTNVTVSLRFSDTTIQGTGPSVLAALKALEKPIKITTKSVITVSKGTKSHSRPLTIPLAQRLFYPAAQVYQAKNFELLLK